MDRPTVPENVVVADGPSLERLYARFNAMPRSAVPADSSAHRSVIARLASNQRRAAALGWSEFVLERASASGRLELRGRQTPSHEHELVPDAIAPNENTPGEISASIGSAAAVETRHAGEGRIGTDLANISWRFRVRPLGDSER